MTKTVLYAVSMVFLFIFLIAYLIGSIPFGLILVKLAGKGDIRKIGSGNIGATNVLRTGSKKLAALTLFLDGGKGFIAVWIIAKIVNATDLGPMDWTYDRLIFWAAAGVLCGHLFPIWLKFRGGKGVATALGIYLALDWRIGVTACITWLVVAILSRYSSLAALGAMVMAFTAATFFMWHSFHHMATEPADHEIALDWDSLIIALMVIARHHANIRRLLNGTEPKIGKSKTETTNAAP